MKKRETNSDRIIVRAQPSLIKSIALAAKSAGVSRSEFVRSAVANQIAASIDKTKPA